MSVVLVDVGYQFPGNPFLFRHLNVTLQPGYTHAVIGPSGAGKSTLLALLAGWLDPVEGVVNRESVSRSGWVFQNPHGVARRSALDHVVLPFLAQGLTRAQAAGKAMALLEDFGLAESAGRDFSALSGGEAQRLMLARAIAADPDLLLVDEPTAQLDTTTAANVNEVLHALSGRGSIVVIATHDPATERSCSMTIDLRDYAERESRPVGDTPFPVGQGTAYPTGGISFPAGQGSRFRPREGSQFPPTGGTRFLAPEQS